MRTIGFLAIVPTILLMVGGSGHADSRDEYRICSSVSEGSTATLSCPGGFITSIDFASYGTPDPPENPDGVCADFTYSWCHASTSQAVVEDRCLGETTCSVSASNYVFGDPCYGTLKRLYIKVSCGSEFSDFSLTTLQLDFRMEDDVNDRFNITGGFELNQVNDGMDLLSEDLTIEIGTSRITVPAGSFYLDDNQFRCDETINGSVLQAGFEDWGSDRWSFVIRAIGVDLTGTANPDRVILTVGNDWGEAAERLDGSLSLNKGIEVEP